MADGETGGDFWTFLKARKRLWLILVAVVLLLFGAMVIFSFASSDGPFNYTQF